MHRDDFFLQNRDIHFYPYISGDVTENASFMILPKSASHAARGTGYRSSQSEVIF